MPMKFKLITISFTTGILLLIVLCLGAQNLTDRHSLKIGISKTAPLPSGFLVGISIALGVISGGSATALLIPSKNFK